LLTHIDLFSGIGGFALVAQWAGFETVAFVEIEPYAQEIIKQNFGAVEHANGSHSGTRGFTERSLSNEFGSSSKIYSDILAFDGTPYRGATLLTGGFPCQPFSQAGKRRGKEDHRYLWSQMLRIIHKTRPTWVLGENVAGIVTMELDRVLSDLEGEGYAVQSLVIPACAVDAKHRRDRVWIVGHAEERTEWAGLRESEQGRERRRRLGDSSGETVLADAYDLSGRIISQSDEWGFSESNGGPWGCWLPEPDVGRVAHGIPARVDRLKGLGNAIVPQVAFEIVKGIAEIEERKLTI
jgi:DNA (cytosine-5)-methyltransferase 1